MYLKTTLTILLILFIAGSNTKTQAQAIIIDHSCENLSQIPDEWVDSVQENLKWHYAHTSHGSQLTTGLQRIEDNDATYSYARGSSSLPSEADAFCVFDGQEGDTYISPDEYWETQSGTNKTRSVLTNNPTLNISQWSWCTQVNSYSESQIQAYLDSISTLEDEYPNVTFVYMTGNAQATGSSGYNRYLNNEHIRQYCRDNNKILFDFADLDSWWFNPTSETWEQNTYEYEGHTIPVEHSEFNGDEAGHTTFASCEQKGRAVWWLMARVAGWDEGTSVINEISKDPSEYQLDQNYPNPFNPKTTINYQLPTANYVELTVFDVLGHQIKTLVNGRQEAGAHTVNLDGTGLASGIYYYKLTAGRYAQMRKMTLIK